MSPKGEGAGRKPLPKNKVRKPRSFKASDQEWEEIKTLADKAGVSVSEYIRICALKHTKESVNQVSTK